MSMQCWTRNTELSGSLRGLFKNRKLDASALAFPIDRVKVVLASTRII